MLRYQPNAPAFCVDEVAQRALLHPVNPQMLPRARARHLQNQ